MKKDEMLPPELQKEYILIDLDCKKYDKLYGWNKGDVLIRISPWYSGNGCGAKQAYFIPKKDLHANYQIAWDDHVKEITDQLEFEL